MTVDKELLDKFLKPFDVCMRYTPKFGQGNKEEGVTLSKFLSLYGSDPFYNWCGLNSEKMYAAHKAAGGMTSLYRQIGKGCENLFREIIIKTTDYKDRNSAAWSYTGKTKSEKDKTLSLDARIEFNDIRNQTVLKNINLWVDDYVKILKAKRPNDGVVFEVRQGYKSKDSKRQNGDIDNVAVAWSNQYMPVFAIFSSQIDNDLVTRYKNNKAGIIVGSNNGDSTSSLFKFCKDVLGYDLCNFFDKNSDAIKSKVEDILTKLLSAS